MKLSELMTQFISGTPVKRKPWGGYWKYTRGQVEMHNKDGSVVIITDTTDILFTISNILAEDWEIATNENCEIPVAA